MKFSSLIFLSTALLLLASCSGGKNKNSGKIPGENPSENQSTVEVDSSRETGPWVTKTQYKLSNLPFPENLKRHPSYFSITEISATEHQKYHEDGTGKYPKEMELLHSESEPDSDCFEFVANNGNVIEYCSEIADPDVQGNEMEAVTYTSLGFATKAGAWFVEELGNEWFAILMVEKATGNEFEMHSQPVLSPSGEWMVVCADFHESCYMAGGVKLFRQGKAGWEEYFDLNNMPNCYWGADDPVWVSDAEFLFITRKEIEFENRSKTKVEYWRFSIQPMR